MRILAIVVLAEQPIMGRLYGMRTFQGPIREPVDGHASGRAVLPSQAEVHVRSFVRSVCSRTACAWLWRSGSVMCDTHTLADPKQRCVRSDISINTLNGTFPASWSSLSTLEELCV